MHASHMYVLLELVPYVDSSDENVFKIEYNDYIIVI